MPSGWRSNYTRYKNFFLNVLRAYQTRPDLKSFLEIILSLATVVIFSIFAIKPTVLTIIELNKNINDKEGIVSSLNQKIKNLQTASVVLEQQSSSVANVGQSVPDIVDVDGAIGQILGLASSSSVNVLNISSSEIVLYGEQADDNKKKNSKQESLPQSADGLPLTISVTGNYTNLYSFLTSVENLRRPIKVDSFAVNSSLTDEGVILVMLITGRLPYLTE